MTAITNQNKADFAIENDHMLGAVHPLNHGNNMDKAIIIKGEEDNDSDAIKEEMEIVVTDKSHTPTP